MSGVMSDRRDLALSTYEALLVSKHDAPLGQRLAWRDAIRDYVNGEIEADEMERRIDGALGLRDTWGR